MKLKMPSNSRISLDYAVDSLRKPHYRKLAVVTLMTALIGACGYSGAVYAIGVIRKATLLNQIQNPNLPVGRVILADPTDKVLTTAERYARTSRSLAQWSFPLKVADRALKNVQRVDMRTETWPGLAYVGPIETSRPAIVRIGIGVRTLEHTFIDLNIEMTEQGGAFQPSKPLMRRPIKWTAVQSSKVAPDDRRHAYRVTTCIAFLSLSDQFEMGAAQPVSGSPGTIRIPIWHNKQSDTLLLSMDDDESVKLVLESGAALPIQSKDLLR